MIKRKRFRNTLLIKSLPALFLIACLNCKSIITDNIYDAEKRKKQLTVYIGKSS